MQSQSFKLEEIQVNKIPGKYDYFLESVVCLLFGCSEFRRIFTQASRAQHSCYPKCIPCLLADVYNLVMTSKKLDVTNLKSRLSSLYKEKKVFQPNQPADAMECLNAILNAFHCKTIGDNSDGLNEESLNQSCESSCIAHSLFSLGVVENYKCECRSQFETEWDYSNYCQYFNIAEILVQANFDYSNDLLTVPLFKLKNYRSESNSDLSGNMMNNLQKKLSAAEADFCNQENCTKKKSKIEFKLQNPPSIYIVNVIWESDDAGHLDSFISTISITDSVTMRNIYGNSTNDAYNLRGILFYGRTHYEYALRTENFWAFKGLDDQCGWPELLKEITIMNYHPVCLVYEKSQRHFKLSIEKSELLEIEKLACECDHYENKVHEEYYNDLASDCSGLFKDRKLNIPAKEIIQNDRGKPANNIIESGIKSNISTAVNSGYSVPSRMKEDQERSVPKNQIPENPKVNPSRYNIGYEESPMSYASQTSEKSPDVMSSLEIQITPPKVKTWKCNCGLENPESWDVCTKCQGLKPGLKGWVCKSCTTVNSDNRLKCESCSLVKDTSNKNQEDYWMCNSCSSYNIGSRTNCSKCRNLKPKQENTIPKQPEIESKKVESNTEWLCRKCNGSNFNYSINCVFCRAPKQEKPVEEEKNDLWTCESCKTKNKATSKYCVKCYGNKPVIIDQPPSQNTSWKCSKCNTNNSSVSVRCSLCSALKVQTNDNWTCLCCAKVNANTTTICGSCKARKDTPKSQCSQCGVQIDPSKTMCDACSRPTTSEIWTCKFCYIQNTTTTCRKCSYSKVIAAVKVAEQKVVQQAKAPSIICSSCKSPTTIVTCPGCMKPTNLASSCVYCGKSLASANLCSNCKLKAPVVSANTNAKTKKCRCGYDNKFTAQRCLNCKRAL
ncbi:hypothetical protein SteCoe_26784 [Stentor coeruleus]|uniref:RanBP2-type domain-containing protein n=1 Tax=Stentor coeruleus TaxID=5963 RepID=A0A1R2BC41_9CILI|nr:hypothetical protein SteCoe_26784 [Stentor coeruleus]